MFWDQSWHAPQVVGIIGLLALAAGTIEWFAIIGTVVVKIVGAVAMPFKKRRSSDAAHSKR